ncbi:MAG: histidine phosphatase family protein [Anaerolineaceae bacterium]|nr:histidine phosphatase family protein [Anaerolineaceae bacterium]
MTKFWLIRHGQTDWNAIRRYQGSSDQPLNSIGLEQAKLAAERLIGKPITAVYSSDLKRAHTTAEMIAQVFALEVQLDRRLREVNLGDWEGMLFSDITEKYPEKLQERQDSPLMFRPPGNGETIGEVAERVLQVVQEIAAAHPDEEVCLVAHGLSLASLLCIARQKPLGEAYQCVLENAKPELIVWNGN